LKKFLVNGRDMAIAEALSGFATKGTVDLRVRADTPPDVRHAAIP